MTRKFEKVYLVTHFKEDSESIDGFKIVGIFSTEEKAEAVIKELSQAPGFSEHKEGFSVGPYEVNRNNWEGGFLSGFDAIIDE